jgi:hypothetical protein
MGGTISYSNPSPEMRRPATVIGITRKPTIGDICHNWGVGGLETAQNAAGDYGYAARGVAAGGLAWLYSPSRARF